MSSRVRALSLAAGLFGLAASLPNLLPPLIESLLLGSSVGLVVASPLEKLAAEPTPRKEVRRTPEEKLMLLVHSRKSIREQEHQRVLDSFDELLSNMDHSETLPANPNHSSDFGSSVDQLTEHYPEWDNEGRLRTYVLMKKIGESLSLGNADKYLDMAYRTLVSRGAEAAEISRTTLNGRVERLYRNPESERARRLAGTLLLMNRGDDDYAKEMVIEAIHLWSDTRFARLKQDFAAVALLGTKEEESIVQLVEKEVEKTKRARDAVASKRAQELWSTITIADSRQKAS